MPDRHALVIGINQYPHFDANPLRGCVNDANLIGEVLKGRFQFPREHVQLLLDEEATEKGILAALDDLVERVGNDDVVVVSYSGHGSYYIDPEALHAADGCTETIVPHDSGRGEGEYRDIPDHAIRDRLVKLAAKTGDITLVFDSCHSGGVVRAEAAVRRVEPMVASGAGGHGAGAARRRDAVHRGAFQRGAETGGGVGRGSAWQRLVDRYVLVAGCHDDEVACEHPLASGEVHGALTWFLCQALLEAPGDVSWRDVFETVAARVHAEYSRQTPQLEGATDRRVFGAGFARRDAYFLVDPGANGHLRVRGGIVHGLTTGSLLDVFPPGARPGNGATPLARIELTEVRAGESLAVRHDGVAPRTDVAPASRAVEVAHDHRDLRLVVRLAADVDGDVAADLAERLERSPFLDVAGPDAAPGEVVVHLLAPRQRPADDDAVPQLGAVARPTWAVIDPSGRLVLPAFAAGGASRERLATNLERLARRRAVLALRNPQPSELHGAVDLRFLRGDGAGGAVEVETGKSGFPLFREGDHIVLGIRNDSEHELHCYVLDFGFRHGIELLFPVGGGQDRLAAGREVLSGTRGGEEIELSIPHGWPFDPADDPAGGLEPMMLLASTVPLDVAALTQEGVRHGGPQRTGRSALDDLLAMAFRGSGLRDASRLARPAEAWTTLVRTFELRRR